MSDRFSETVPSSGLAPTYHAAEVGGDRVPPGALLHVDNGSGGSINVTLVTPSTVDTDLAIADRVVAVPATSRRFIRVPKISAYQDVDGMVAVQWSAVTTVTFAVLV